MRKQGEKNDTKMMSLFPRATYNLLLPYESDSF